MAFMSKLQEMRNRAGLSQKDLAERSGVNFRAIQDYEQKHKNIDGAKIGTLAALSVALGCKISDIMENPENVKNARL
jgi:Helix-turn-helix.